MTADDIKKHVELMVRSEDPLQRELAVALLYGALLRANDEIERLAELVALFKHDFGPLSSDGPTIAEINGGQE